MAWITHMVPGFASLVDHSWRIAVRRTGWRSADHGPIEALTSSSTSGPA